MLYDPSVCVSDQAAISFHKRVLYTSRHFVCAANFSEADSNKMMNKINFHATEVGRHENVLAMIGAVLDSTHRKYT